MLNIPLSKRSSHLCAEELSNSIRSGQNIALIARPNASISQLLNLTYRHYCDAYGDHVVLHRPVDVNSRVQPIPSHLGLDVLVDDALTSIEQFPNGLGLDAAHAVCAFMNTYSLMYLNQSWSAAFGTRRLDRVIELRHRGEFIEHPVNQLRMTAPQPYSAGYSKTHTSFRRHT